ncbi:hypothetical protein VTN77DRAFT_7221 [Rasamsonia byssochlamydoides]|uniref:uncharacterized protein n=1 Tax=Rasamsonia byssochlamydoides TaxID=89139 RepID=UPI003742921F
MQHRSRLPTVSRILLSTALAFFLIFLCVLFLNLTGSRRVKLPPLPDQPSPASQSDGDRRCDAFPHAANTLIIVKTGANVIYDKLPIQLLTALRCARDPLIFSDLAQTLGPYRVYDVLDNVTEDIKNGPEFDYYRTLQDYQKSGQDVRTLCETSRDAAWKLDRFKFIHMLKKTWTMRPHHDWYAFVEDDTYLMWTNLMLWLERLDPSEPLYLGSQTYFNNEAFAHGGSGIILSRETMSRVLDEDPDITARYDRIVQNEIYGDYTLMKALQEKGISLGLYKPMLQGEKQNTLRFGPGRYLGERYWCQPLITMHHVTPVDVDSIWRFEQQRTDLTKPLLIADMYEYFMGRDLPSSSREDDWYNFSEDLFFRSPEVVHGDRQLPPDEMTPVQKEAHQSFEQCAKACDEHPRCFQYVHVSSSSQQTCAFSFSYRLGERRLPGPEGTRYQSGWNMAKIVRDQAENACHSPQWSGFN